jgi:hypothetical protein
MLISIVRRYGKGMVGGDTTIAPKANQHRPSRDFRLCNQQWTGEYLDSVRTCTNQPNRRVILPALLCLLILPSEIFGQRDPRTFTVGAAIENAARLGSSQILVRGHFWWGKEGSMVFDSGYRTILRLRYSDAFLSKHPYHEMFPSGKTRKSDIVMITGRLQAESNGRLVLIADDIQFAENLK